MSQSDSVALAELLYPALATGDRAALDRLLAEDFVGETTPGLPLGLGGRYDSARSMRREFWGAIARDFDVRAEPERFDASGEDRVVVSGVYRGSARSTGRKFEAPFIHTITTSDDRITTLTQVTDSAAWQAALEPLADAHVAPTDDPVTLSIADGVAHLRLNRGPAANAIDQATARGIRTAVARCRVEPSIRVVLITGAGERFSTGGDLKLFAGTAAEELPALLDDMITDFHIGLTELAALPVPVVCVVQGAVAGGALGLIHAADIVLAAKGTKFALGFSALALSGDGGSTWYLPRLIGAKAAALMYLENRVLPAEEALRLGLVSEVLAPEALAARTDALVATLAAGPTKALGAMRLLLRRSAESGLVDQLDAERRTIVEMARHPDVGEGIAAFVDKRTPAFHGS